MVDKFVETVAYLKKLKQSIQEMKEEITAEEKLLLVIKDAVLNDSLNRGSLIFTKEQDKYIVSNIQKRRYAWDFVGQVIDLPILINEFNKLGINYSLKEFPIKDHLNDYELSFGITLENEQKKVVKTYLK